MVEVVISTGTTIADITDRGFDFYALFKCTHPHNLWELYTFVYTIHSKKCTRRDRYNAFLMSDNAPSGTRNYLLYRRTLFNCEYLLIANCEFFLLLQLIDSQI